MSPKIIISFLLISLSIGSCLQTDDIELEKRLVFEYSFDGMNNVYTTENDTLRIDNIRLYVSRMWFVTTSEDSLNTTDPYIFSYSSGDIGVSREVFSARLGFSGYEDFDDYQIRIAKFSNTSGLTDNELLNQGDTLSYFIRGEFNGERFNYQSNQEFDISLPFEEVNLTDRQETITVSLIGNAAEWFRSTSQSTFELLDPADQQNLDQINENLKNSFRIEAERSSQLITE